MALESGLQKLKLKVPGALAWVTQVKVTPDVKFRRVEIHLRLTVQGLGQNGQTWAEFDGNFDEMQFGSAIDSWDDWLFRPEATCG